MPNGSTALRNEKWDSWTCVYGWPVYGIWKGYDENTIHHVTRSNQKIRDGYHLLARGND